MDRDSDLKSIPRKRGTQDGNEPTDGNLATDGYETLDRAEPGRARRGIAADGRHSMEAMDYYRPRGR